jgi:hypothetical protein
MDTAVGPAAPCRALAIMTMEIFPMRERRHAGGRSSRVTSRGVGVVFLLVVACLPGLGQAQDDTQLAQKSQNPVADLISVPLENDLNFGVGPREDLQYILQAQPVIPFRLTRDWNLISRTILPVVHQPELAPGFGNVSGLGDIVESLFLSPARPGKVIWGVGPILQFPSATDDALGQGKWGAGPTAVALTIQGPWLIGALVNNVWSFAGRDDRPDLNQMLIQPFVIYTLPGAWTLESAPTITADWKADRDNDGPSRWGAAWGRSCGWGSFRWAHRPGRITTWCARTTRPSGSCASGSSSCSRRDAGGQP